MDKSPCCQAWIVEASEGNWCSKCKEDVKGVATDVPIPSKTHEDALGANKIAPKIPSHSLARTEAIGHNAWVSDAPEFPLGG